MMALGGFRKRETHSLVKHAGATERSVQSTEPAHRGLLLRNQGCRMVMNNTLSSFNIMCGEVMRAPRCVSNKIETRKEDGSSLPCKMY